jgi:hypothetical protein
MVCDHHSVSSNAAANAVETAKKAENKDQKSYGFGTIAIHAGQAPDAVTGAVVVPISLSTTFAQASPGVHKVSYLFLLLFGTTARCVMDRSCPSVACGAVRWC